MVSIISFLKCSNSYILVLFSTFSQFLPSLFSSTSLFYVFTSSLPFRSSSSHSLSIPFAFCSPSSYGLPFSGSSNCLLLFAHMVCVTLGCVVACRRPRWSPFFLPYNWSVPRMEKIIPLNSMQFRGIKRSRIVPHVVVP